MIFFTILILIAACLSLARESTDEVHRQLLKQDSHLHKLIEEATRDHRWLEQQNYIFDMSARAHDYIATTVAQMPVKRQSGYTLPADEYLHESHVNLFVFLHKLKVRPRV